MRERKLLNSFLIFSISILLILLGVFYYREYIRKPKKINEPVNKVEYVENKIVQNEVEKAEREKVVENVIYYEVLQDVKDVKNTEQTNELPKAEMLQINYNDLIINSAMADQNFVNAVISHLQLNPNKILNTFYMEGWKVCITKEDLYNKLVLTENEKKEERCVFIAGLTIIEEKTIYIAYDDRAIKNYTTIHEIGHYTDIIYKWPSCTDKYKNIYVNEAQSLNSQTRINNNKELFAETYKYVILQRTEYDYLETYQYVEDIIY